MLLCIIIFKLWNWSFTIHSLDTYAGEGENPEETQLPLLLCAWLRRLPGQDSQIQFHRLSANPWFCCLCTYKILSRFFCSMKKLKSADFNMTATMVWVYHWLLIRWTLMLMIVRRQKLLLKKKNSELFIFSELSYKTCLALSFVQVV